MRATTMAWAVLAGNLCLAGCQPESTEQVPPPPQQPEADRANAFFEQAFDAQLALSPMSQSYLGVKDDYDKWDDFSDASYQRRLDLLATQRAELTDKIGVGNVVGDQRDHPHDHGQHQRANGFADGALGESRSVFA